MADRTAKVGTELLTNLDGTMYEERSLVNGAVKSDILPVWDLMGTVTGNSKGNDASKCVSLAMRLREGKPFVIDQSDFNLIKKCVKDAQLSAFIEHQLNEELESWKEKPAKR